jgi:hypothetical protein
LPLRLRKSRMSNRSPLASVKPPVKSIASLPSSVVSLVHYRHLFAPCDFAARCCPVLPARARPKPQPIPSSLGAQRPRE